jgi:transposase
MRRARRHAELSEVHDLARKGYSQHAIARHTGRHRRTIRSWLAQEIPTLSAETREIAARVATGGADSVLRRRRWTPARQARLQELAQAGLSHSAIARITGLHRVTVARWLVAEPGSGPSELPPEETRDADSGAFEVSTTSAEEPMAEETAADEEVAAPPAPPWSSWAQVWQVREALKEHRGLLLRRPDHLTAAQQETIDRLVAGPLGHLVGVARRFLVEWYALWRAADGQRRPLWRHRSAMKPGAPTRPIGRCRHCARCKTS